MSNYYTDPRALHATEERLIKVSKELDEAKETIRNMLGDYDAQTLRIKIAQLDEYDTSVRMIIAADHNLQEAWDNFAVLYQLTASEKLLTTAREKIARKSSGVCHACKQSLGASR